jgi:putative hydrolase of the HAD superfamily
MVINLLPRTVLAFDLDDTLYKEIDFVRSGFAAIVSAAVPAELFDLELARMLAERNTEINPLDSLFTRYPYGISVKEMVAIYREHLPSLSLPLSLRRLFLTLRSAGVRTAVITDGRSITQRNKIRALELEPFIDITIISEEIGSEKPSARNFEALVNAFGDGDYFYFADNPIKDFLTPNQLGWTTIGLLNDGRNIHQQSRSLPKEHLPHHWLRDWSDLRVTLGQGREG